MAEFIEMSTGYSDENISDFWQKMKNNDQYLKEKIERVPRGVVFWTQQTSDFEGGQSGQGILARDLVSGTLLMQPVRNYELCVAGFHGDGDTTVSARGFTPYFRMDINNSSYISIQISNPNISAANGPVVGADSSTVGSPLTDPLVSENVTYKIYLYPYLQAAHVEANDSRRFTLIFQDVGRLLYEV